MTDFNFVEQQEQLRARLNDCGETAKRVAELHPDLKERWVAGFGRRERPSASVENLQALREALDRLDEIRAFEQRLMTPGVSSTATV